MKSGGAISKINDELRATLTEYIARSVHHDASLIAKCVPKYAPTARRMIVDNGWYEALTRDNVELVTAGIRRMTDDAIESNDGVRREVDLIILAAGFEVSRYFWPIRYVGSGGRTLEEAWSKDGPRAFKGVTIPGFPNFFAFYGPNSQPRTGGLYTWAEIWSRYVGELLVGMIEGRATEIECRAEAFVDLQPQTRRGIAPAHLAYRGTGRLSRERSRTLGDARAVADARLSPRCWYRRISRTMC